MIVTKRKPPRIGLQDGGGGIDNEIRFIDCVDSETSRTINIDTGDLNEDPKEHNITKDYDYMGPIIGGVLLHEVQGQELFSVPTGIYNTDGEMPVSTRISYRPAELNRESSLSTREDGTGLSSGFPMSLKSIELPTVLNIIEGSFVNSLIGCDPCDQ